MSYLIVGLGNVGKEYVKTRHNTGHIMVSLLDGEPKLKKKAKFIALESMMNNSGKALLALIPKSLKPNHLVIVHDDLDLPLGSFKLSFNRGAGGHRGVESIIKALKTQEFWRLRLGITPATPTGKLKKPKGEKQVINFILGEFSPAELTKLKKVAKSAVEALESKLN